MILGKNAAEGAGVELSEEMQGMDDVLDALYDSDQEGNLGSCLLYTSPSPRDQRGSRMPSSA